MTTLAHQLHGGIGHIKEYNLHFFNRRAKETELRWGARFETLGALGLVLPGLTRVRTELTLLAAAGLLVIMVGAVVTTGAIGGVGAAAVPAVVGALCAVVAYERSTVTVGRTALQPAS